MPRVGGGRLALRLDPIAGPDIAAVWSEFAGIVIVLTASALAGLILVYLTLGAALAPLQSLREAFDRIGTGDYAGRVTEQGPPELEALERAFNAMAGQLQAMRVRNAALEDQLSSIQDEERAELARDLHDEMGPHLFAVKIDAQIVAGLLADPPRPDVAERLGAIQAAATHMQRLVRDMLARLRPPSAVELGLHAAIGDLVGFWRDRRPDVTVELDLAPEAAVPEPLWETCYRVAQEGLNNAMRHANAATVRISIVRAGEEALVVEVSDDGARREVAGEGGYGLIGLRERVRASKGVLQIETGRAGWTVRARLPTAVSREAA